MARASLMSRPRYCTAKVGFTRERTPGFTWGLGFCRTAGFLCAVSHAPRCCSALGVSRAPVLVVLDQLARSAGVSKRSGLVVISRGGVWLFDRLLRVLQLKCCLKSAEPFQHNTAWCNTVTLRSVGPLATVAAI